MAERRQERRKFRRFALSCPTTFQGDQGSVIARGKTLNISDGGAYVVVTVDALRRMGRTAHMEVTLPRTTLNSHLMERFTIPAHILRHEPMLDDRHAGVAVQFANPHELGLE